MTKEEANDFSKFQCLEELIDQGHYDDALKLAEDIERDKANTLNAEEGLSLTLLQSEILYRKENYKEALRLAEQALTWSQSLGNPLQEVDAHIKMAKPLAELGDYGKSLAMINRGEEILKKLSKEPEAPLIRRKALLIAQKGDNLKNMGELDQGLALLEQSLELAENLSNDLDKARILHSLGSIYCFRGESDPAIDYFEQSQAYYEKVGNERGVNFVLHCIGAMYSNKGELERALEYSEQSLAIRRKLGDKSEIAQSLITMSWIFNKRGDLDQALAFAEECYSLLKELDIKSRIAQTLNTIGELWGLKGDMNSALHYLEQGLALAQEIGQKNLIAESQFYIGRIMYQQGNLDQALDYLTQTLHYTEESENKLWMANIFFNLICIAIDNGTYERAQDYLHSIEQIDAQLKNKVIDQYYRLAKAKFLAISPRIRDKAKAQEIYQEIVEEEIVNHQLTVMAMVNLCELLLDELKAYGESEALLEAKQLGEKLSTLAEKQSSFSLVANARILQAKFAMVEGQLTEATALLEKAKITAEAKGLGLLAEKIVSETQQMEKEYDRWQNLIQRNAPFYERLEQARFQEHLNDALKIVRLSDMKSKGHDESPRPCD
ncbi:MAG: tetratricopeptide repeat protein [Candidatus Thorarchaeota archaeon]